MSPSSYDLGYLPTLLDFINFVCAQQNTYPFGGLTVGAGLGRYFCTHCAGDRRMKFKILVAPNVENPSQPEPLGSGARRRDAGRVHRTKPGPALFIYDCGECDTRYVALVYQSPNGPRLAIFPEAHGGLATEHTPKPVAFYLDEAHESQSVGANSGAVTMYRSAVEHILFEQGYKKRMLGAKVKQLEGAIANRTEPSWAYELDVDDLNLLKDLGNYSIHPNDGDVAKQDNFDQPLLQNVRITVIGLIDLIYEAPLKKEQRKTALKAARARSRFLPPRRRALRNVAARPSGRPRRDGYAC